MKRVKVEFMAAEVTDKFGKSVVLLSKRPTFASLEEGVKEYMAKENCKTLNQLWSAYGEAKVSAEIKRQNNIATGV